MSAQLDSLKTQHIVLTNNVRKLRTQMIRMAMATYVREGLQVPAYIAQTYQRFESLHVCAIHFPSQIDTLLDDLEIFFEI